MCHTYPIACSLCNIFSDLLGTQAKRTNLGSQGGRGTDLTSRGTEGDFLDFIGVKLGRHFDGGLGEGLVVGLVVVLRMLSLTFFNKTNRVEKKVGVKTKMVGCGVWEP